MMLLVNIMMHMIMMGMGVAMAMYSLVPHWSKLMGKVVPWYFVF